MDFALSRGRAFLFVLITWALVYLPGLGREGLKGEEGRRALPAVEMLKTHNWILPRIGGADYYSKPPGINWLVAASFAITGEQTELTARLPSVLFVLIFAAMLIWLPASPDSRASRGGPSPPRLEGREACGWMGVPARLMAAIIFLTNIALVEKGRLIEIEAVYISLTGIAILLWLNIWFTNGPRWLLWLAPSIVLAFGMLVKGPFILIFFYSVVIAVLCYSGRFKSLFSIWHFIGAGIIVFLFLGWLYLASQQTSASKMTSQMGWQLLMRILGKLELFYWGQNIVRSFTAFLPWLLFVPMLWDKNLTSQIEQQNLPLFRGCRLGIVIGFVAIVLMPKMEARYTMPVIPLTSVLIGWLLSLRPAPILVRKDHSRLGMSEFQNGCGIATDRLWKGILLFFLLISCLTATGGLIFVSRSPATIIALVLAVCATAIVFWRRNEIQNTLGLTLVTGLVCIIVMLQWTSFGLDIVTSRETRKPAAMMINGAIPESETIYIYKPISYLYPTVFRLRPPIDYVLDANDVNEQMHYLLIKKADLETLKADKKIGSYREKAAFKLFPRKPEEFYLVELNRSRD